MGTTMPATLEYRRPDGEIVKANVEPAGAVDDPNNHPDAYLPDAVRVRAVRVDLAERPIELRQLVVEEAGAGEREAAYDLIDHEILAGLRLARWHRLGRYPAQLSRLEGHELPGEKPFALLEPYRGTPVAEIAGQLLAQEQRAFQISLLTALRRLGAAGLAHRAISPDTVRWDGVEVQITDFMSSRLIGAPRSITGSPPWAPREQQDRADVVGWVTDRDDVWATGRLLFFVVTGQEPTQQALARRPELAELLAGVFGHPVSRPSAVELLRRFRVPDPILRFPPADGELAAGRDEFHRERLRKHPHLAAPVVPPPPAAAPEQARRGRFWRRNQEGGASNGKS